MMGSVRQKLCSPNTKPEPTHPHDGLASVPNEEPQTGQETPYFRIIEAVLRPLTKIPKYES